MMKKEMFALIILGVVFSAVGFAQGIDSIPLDDLNVKINEFTVDPQTDWGNSSQITSSDEWIELYNSELFPINISGWNLSFIDNTPQMIVLNATIPSHGYYILLDPAGQQNNDGRIVLYNSNGLIVDSVSYGSWNDGNVSDNAPSGNADDPSDECLARIPNGADTNKDNEDFVKTTCTYGSENLALAIECSNNNDCGTDGLVGDNFCIANNITRELVTYTCNNPGTAESFCSSSNENRTLETCEDICLAGICFESVSIVNGVFPPSTCFIQTENITVSAEITGSIESVFLALNTNGSWQNITLQGNSPGTYSYKIDSSLLTETSIVYWEFFVLDISGNLVYSVDGVQSVDVHSATMVSINPEPADGTNNWYITEPVFTLSNNDTNNIFYEWDSSGTIEYSGPFGLEDTPNNASATGGILELSYWSDVCNGSEEKKELLIKTDFLSPIIKDELPEDSSATFDARPEIKVLIDEKYQGNSGLNESSVEMFLDSALVAVVISPITNMKSLLIYNPVSDLSIGEHTVLVNVEDNAGRSSSFSWSFEIQELVEFEMNVNSPLNGIYTERRLPFNLTLSREAEKIEFINYNDRNPRFKKLCEDCESYGLDRRRLWTFSEGENNLTIRAHDPFNDDSIEQNILLFVDSKEPKIKKTSPVRGLTNGSFEVWFDEQNPVQMLLNYGNETESRNVEVNLSECIDDGGRGVKCSLHVELSDFENQVIKYWLSLEDIAGNKDETRARELKVDTVAPVINSFNFSQDGRKIGFLINISEENFDEAFYIDSFDNNQREKRICSGLKNGLCERKVSFRNGNHSLDLFARDEAGNDVTVVENLDFEVI